jgi:CRISPR-associated protein Cas2
VYLSSFIGQYLNIDLKTLVKQEKMFLRNYKLETALQAYGIDQEIRHRALEDAKLTYLLSTKVKAFSKNLK